MKNKKTLQLYFMIFCNFSYSNMLGIDPKIVAHNMVLAENTKPIRQKFKKKNPKIALLVKVEIEKILEDGFIRPIYYSPWISNIFTFAKPENRISMCRNFCNLNKASLKDDFPLPNIDMIVDSTAGHDF